MTCRSAEAAFEAYLDDALLPVQRARITRHVRSCGACTGVLEELRVLDALLAGPPALELPPNFTFATMAEVGTLPRPQAPRVPVAAFLVSYLVAAWLLIGAAFLLAADAVRAFAETAFDLSAQIVHAFGAVGAAGARMAHDFGGPSSFLGTAVVLDIAVVAVIVAGLAAARPRAADRLRS